MREQLASQRGITEQRRIRWPEKQTLLMRVYINSPSSPALRLEQ